MNSVLGMLLQRPTAVWLCDTKGQGDQRTKGSDRNELVFDTKEKAVIRDLSFMGSGKSRRLTGKVSWAEKLGGSLCRKCHDTQPLVTRQ